MKTDSTNEPRFPALLAAVLLPGLGHVVAGERLRGLFVAVGILGLFFGGMLVGGIDTIDRKDNGVWFIGQALVGPLAFGVDYLHQEKFKAYDPSIMGAATLAQVKNARKRSGYPDEQMQDAEVSTNQGRFKVKVWGKAPPGGGPPNATSVGKVNELGTLFSTIAGMLNLIAIIDAGFPGRPRKQRKEGEPGPADKGVDKVLTGADVASTVGGGQ
ncbi:MAG TPA: DUF6677 family protein [Phycisphaerales bacterium]|nr:DUF6677 family protein [Phycisphaerales bacterium]